MLKVSGADQPRFWYNIAKYNLASKIPEGVGGRSKSDGRHDRNAIGIYSKGRVGEMQCSRSA